MLPDQSLQLSDQIGIPPLREVALDPLLQTGQAQLLQSRDLGLGERLVQEVRERRTTPEGEPLGEPSLLLQSLETLEVELALLDVDEVAGLPRHDPLPTQRLAQLGDVYLQRLPRRLRRALRPQRVDQAIPGNDPVRAQQQHAEERPVLCATHVDRAPVLEHFQRPENPKLHRPSPSPRPSLWPAGPACRARDRSRAPAPGAP